MCVGSSAAQEVEVQEMARIIGPVEPSVGMTPFVSDSGAFMLIWEVPDDASVGAIVERATAPDFEEPKVVYAGKDDRTYISGLSAGRYYFRVRLDGEVDSLFKTPPPALIVKIEYQPLGRVFVMMAFGGLTFIATIIIILIGTLCFRRQLAAKGGGHG
jgi:hypothetical protein